MATIHGVEIEIIRKRVKNLCLSVHPPDGRVRMAVPLRVSEAAIENAVVQKLKWIKRQQARFEAVVKEAPQLYLTGERVWFFGRLYTLNVIAHTGRPKITLRDGAYLDLHVEPDASIDRRRTVLEKFYRKELQELVPGLLEKWQLQMKVSVAQWGIKDMKTRWGTCNAQAKRIWLSLHLGKKSPECIEYVVVHELVHFWERLHNRRFKHFMDQLLPQWRFLKRALNA